MACRRTAEQMASIEAEIEKLLKEGKLSRKAIAQKVGISQNTVYAMASGKHAPDYWRKLVQSRIGKPRRPHRRKVPLQNVGPIERCPICRCLVHAPCRACELRPFIGKSRFSSRHTATLDLDLPTDARARQLEIYGNRGKPDDPQPTDSDSAEDWFSK
jgi:DNA-binding XRE family transcriptional regulator